MDDWDWVYSLDLDRAAVVVDDDYGDFDNVVVVHHLQQVQQFFQKVTWQEDPHSVMTKRKYCNYNNHIPLHVVVSVAVVGDGGSIYYYPTAVDIAHQLQLLQVDYTDTDYDD